MQRIDSYTQEQDAYLREKYKCQTHQEIAHAIGRTKDSVRARLKQLGLYKLKPQYINQYGIQRKGYKYILYSNWPTKFDTPCPLLRLCQKCEQLLPAVDFYNCKHSGSGGKDILGFHRSRFCPRCTTDRFIEIDQRSKLIYAARQRAKRDGRQCTLKPEDVRIPEICPIFGFDITVNSNSRATGAPFNSVTLDRINNQGDYTPDNICVMSNKANKLKRDASLKEIMSLTAFLIEWKSGLMAKQEEFIPYAKRGENELLEIILTYLESDRTSK
jgi:hypothetical protein